MNWEYILEVPFESKKKFWGNKRSKYSYSGKAYFMINKNGMVVRDFAQLNDECVEFRPNDNDMMIGQSGNGTAYWNNSNVKEMRLKYFPTSPINKKVEKADKSLIECINDFAIRDHNTILSIEALLSGSNPSGADLKIDATPLWCVDENYYGFKFVNAFKKYRIKNNNSKASVNYSITKSELEKASKLTMSEYFDLFPTKRKEFYVYNPDSRNIIYSEDEKEITQRIYFLDIIEKLTDEQKSYVNLANNIINKYKENFIDKSKAVQRLRGILRSLLVIEKMMIDEPVILERDEKVSNLDAAHLFDVSDIKKLNDDEMWRIADIHNGLLLPKDIHWKFDKDSDFKITSDFKVLYKGNEIFHINDKYKNEQRSEYLKLRNQNV